MAERCRRVLAVASAGGHWVELMRLAPAWEGAEVTFLTTRAEARAALARTASAAGRPPPRVLVVPEATRWSRARLAAQAAMVALALLRVRPDAVLTTGASVGYFALRLGRLMGARTVWVDSIANVEALSMSGAMAGRHADLWLTQWPGLAREGGPLHRGAVL